MAKKLSGTCFYDQRFEERLTNIIAYPQARNTSNIDFSWPETMSTSFDSLRIAVRSRHFLAYLDASKSLNVETDASLFGFGAILMERNDKGTLPPVHNASCTIIAAEESYTKGKKFLAVFCTLKKFGN